MWITTPITIIFTEKGNFVAPESGTTIRFMKKYTAIRLLLRSHLSFRLPPFSLQLHLRATQHSPLQPRRHLPI